MTPSNDESRSCAERRGWTPGPWAILNGKTIDETFMVVGSDGQDFGLIADVTMQEDAHLIAAAPDLVDALERAKGWIAKQGFPNTAEQICGAALAKARAQ